MFDLTMTQFKSTIHTVLKIEKKFNKLIILFFALIGLGIFWFLKSGSVFQTKPGTIKDVVVQGSGTCAIKKWQEWSTDCGGGLPWSDPKCGRWIDQQTYVDEGKSCVTGKDCCSGFCGLSSNGAKSCITSEFCNTYIDREGVKHEEHCVR